MSEKRRNRWHSVYGVTEEELAGDPEVPVKYGDILSTEWTGVRAHKKAGSEGRAAQFSPFAALTGFEDEIKEAARRAEEVVKNEYK